MNKELLLYGRAGCHLCDEMEMELRPLARSYGWSLKVVDVDGDEALAERYGLKVPVLMAGDQEVCHYILDREAVVRCLEGG